MMIFLVGIYRNFSIWFSGWKEKREIRFPQGLKAFIINVLAQRRVFKEDWFGGLMHIFIMWGFVILFMGTVLSSLDHYLFPFLKGKTYLLYSLILDLFGFLFILGIFLAFVRRYWLKLGKMDNLLDDPFTLGLLMTIGLTGFLVEGSRLCIQHSPGMDWSIGGMAFSNLLFPYVDKTWHYGFWWIHSGLSLGFIAYLPYSKSFHILASPVNIYFQAAKPAILTLEEREGLKGDFSRFQLIALDACTRCNRCENVCPVSQSGGPFSPREFIQQMRSYVLRRYGFGARLRKLRDKAEKDRRKEDAFTKGEYWLCTTCRPCEAQCQVCAGGIQIIRETRRAIIEDGRRVPPEIRKALEGVSKYGNPWEGAREKRSLWFKELGVKDLSRGDEAPLLYFVGCLPSYDSRLQEVAKGIVKVLKKGGVDFALLGNEEFCCGDIGRRLGEDGLFEMVVEENYKRFKEFKIRDIITTSPHCYHIFKNEYPLLREKLGIEAFNFRVRHYTQLVASLIEKGGLDFSQNLKKVVTFHDPCYLGRYNGHYQEPRKILEAIPGLRLVEINRTKENSFCCGGGGGRMWLEEGEIGGKISEIRVKEAVEIGADVLATACPFCLSMLEDGVKTAGYEEVLEVKDLIELVAETI